MKISSDWHIHSTASYDATAGMQIADIARCAPELGICDFGITDHVHTPYNLPDLAASRRAFLSVPPSPRFHFGVETSCISQWELAEIASGRHENPVAGVRQGGPAGGALAIGVTADDLRLYGVEYVIGSAHWPMYVPFEREAIIRDYHRQNMFLAAHPLVTIIAHPWWWKGHWRSAEGLYQTEPWFDSFKAIPESMHDEFAGTVLAHGKVVEINIGGILFNPSYPGRFKREYLDYLAYLYERGVALSIGSDCHSVYAHCQFTEAAELLAAVGIQDNNLWRLPPRKKS